MPLPPPTFTKSKWLAFFADLVAKVTHHNVTIVLEGCEIIKRVLISRVSIAAFLEQGDLLQHLLDLVAALVKCEKVPTEMDAEMLFSVAQVLSLVTDMTLSLYSDGDAYLSVLVLSRAANMVDGLTNALKGTAGHMFGFIASIIKSLLSLPLTKRRKALVVDEGVGAINHVRVIEEGLRRAPAILKHTNEVCHGIALGSNGPVQACAQYLSLVTSNILQKHAADEARTLPPISPNTSGDSLPLSPEGARDLITTQTVKEAYGQFKLARGHDDCLAALNSLWCCAVVSSDTTASATTEAEFALVKRFLGTLPVTSLDRVLFRSLLSWFARLISLAAIDPRLRTMLLDAASRSLIPMLMSSESQSMAGGTDASVLTPSMSRINASNASILPSNVPRHEPIGKATVSFGILTFLMALEPTAGEDQVTEWVKSGLLSVITKSIELSGNAHSILIDAPSTVDGTLSDEAYLECALKSCRSEATCMSIVAYKLLSALLASHPSLLREVFAEEMNALLHVLIPVSLKIAVNNPTIMAAEPSTVASVIHHVPRCSRASRATPVGECAIVALDAMLFFANSAGVEVADAVSLLRTLPALARATNRAASPPLRAAVQRMMIHVCTSVGALVTVVREMPSAVPSATTAVLAHSDETPSWETAGSAELLSHVLATASTDAAVDPTFSVCETVLPLQILKLATTSGIHYASSSLMTLLGEVWDQQNRLGARMDVVMHPAVAPNGAKSMPLWQQVVDTTIDANTKLSQVLNGLTPVKVVTKDAHSRALTTFEDIAVQCTYCAAVCRALSSVLAAFPDLFAELRPGTVDALVSSCVNIQVPAEAALAVGHRFGVTVNHPAVLQRAYEDMAVWAMAVGSKWFMAAASMPAELAPLPDELTDALVTLLQSNVVSHHCKGRVAEYLNAGCQLSQQQPTLVESIGRCATPLFVALTKVRPAPHVYAAIARVVALFPSAASHAVANGWLNDQVTRLQHLASELRVNKGLSGMQHEELAVFLSLVASCVSCEGCGDLSRSHAGLVSSLQLFLDDATTRTVTLRACRSMARSTEGRQVMLFETASSDFHTRGLFSKLMTMSFGGKIPAGDAAIGLDAISTAVGNGGESFALAVVKLRVIETVEGTIAALDRQRQPIPAGFLRFLASASLCTEVQPVVARRSSLLTILIDQSAASSERGTLALMTLRNLTFHQSLKTQICQDARIMTAFRNAVLLGAPTSPNPKSPSAAVAAPGEAEYRKQVLALSALRSLIHHNQRGRSYVRGLLKQAPAVSAEAMAAELPDFKHSGTPALRQYHELATASLEALTDVSAASPAAVAAY